MGTSRRNSHIELIRIIAILLIIFSSAAPYGATHVDKYNTFVDLNTPVFSLQYIFFHACRWCGQIGDTLFVVCSAWFLCESKKAKADKILIMVAASWVYSAVSLATGFFWTSPSATEIIKSLLPITFKRNWFVGCYILYYVVHPFINKALEDLPERSLARIAAILFVFYSVMSQVKHFFYFNELIAFISIHIIVSYFKKYKSDGIRNMTKRMMIVLPCILIIIWIVLISKIGPHISLLKNRGLLLCHFYNPAIIIISLGVISLVANKAWRSDLINSIASLSLLVYLAHSSYFWLSYGKYWAYDVITSYGIPMLLTWMILVIVYCIVSLLLALLFNKTIGALVKTIYKKRHS